MTPNSDRDRSGAPRIAEIAALTRRLRALSMPGRDADPAERAAFLADKEALIDRITDTTNAAADDRAKDRSWAGFAAAQAMREALTDAVLVQAAGDGYVLVGPSARTWRRDPDTGRPTVEVPEAEHQAVRDLLGRYALDTTEPEWVRGPDGSDDIHSTVHITDPDDSADSDDTEHEDEWWARAQPATGDGPVVIFDRSDYYSDTEIAEIADAIERGDTERAAHLQDHRDADAADDRVEMPGWMREQAAATDAAAAAGAARTARPDEPGELAARVAVLREHIAAAAAGDGPRAPYCQLVDTEDENQLTRWPTDDLADDLAGRDSADEDSIVLDDGPGLP